MERRRQAIISGAYETERIEILRGAVQRGELKVERFAPETQARIAKMDEEEAERKRSEV